MKIKFLILQLTFISFQLVFNFKIYSQPSITWQHFYEGGYNANDRCYGICRLLNGSNVLTGGTTFYGLMNLKIDDLGNPIWLRHFGMGFSDAPITSVNDGGFLVGAGFKFNSDGDSIWHRNYSNTGIFSIYDVMQTSDNGFLSCGRNVSNLGYIIKTDSLGSIIWFLNINDSNFISPSINFYAVNEGYTNGYIIAGFEYNMYAEAIPIIRTDNAGNIIWRYSYGAGDSLGWVIKIVKIPPFYFLACTCGYIIIDDTGNIIKIKRIFSSQESIGDIFMISASKFVAVTQIFAPSPNEYSSIKLIDTSGNILINRPLKFCDYIVLNKLIRTPNNDFICVGAIDYYNINTDFYAIRIDSNLNYPPIEVKSISKNIPTESILYQNFPNPFNSETIIKMDISREDKYKLSIFDILGRKVDEIFNKDLKIGNYEIKYSPNNLASGIYFYRIESSKNTICRILSYIK